MAHICPVADVAIEADGISLAKGQDDHDDQVNQQAIPALRGSPAIPALADRTDPDKLIYMYSWKIGLH